MIDCLSLGDSIADGLQKQAPACAVMAHKGWTSTRWRQHYHAVRIDADRVVISLGSNDGHGDTASQIAAIRDQVHARRVVWVIPACNARAARAVMAEAARRGDGVLRIVGLSRDGIHPTGRGYRAMLRRSGLIGAA